MVLNSVRMLNTLMKRRDMLVYNSHKCGCLLLAYFGLYTSLVFAFSQKIFNERYNHTCVNSTNFIVYVLEIWFHQVRYEFIILELMRKMAPRDSLFCILKIQVFKQFSRIKNATHKNVLNVHLLKKSWKSLSKWENCS